MYWQWYAIGLIGFFAGFVLGRWWHRSQTRVSRHGIVRDRMRATG
jgi:hypothetical protein